MENQELEEIKNKYTDLLRDLHSNVSTGKIENIREGIQDLILKAYSLKASLEMDEN